jgi:translation initiation factor IF-2
MGIDDLLDNLLLMAEMGEYKAIQDRNAQGSVIEARLEKGRGAVATVLVKQGTLKVGDSLVLGTVSGRVRSMQDHNGKRIKTALPSTPVEIIGLTDVPLAGDDFVVVRNDKDARSLVEHRQEEAKKLAAQNKRPVTLEDLLAQQQAGELLTLNLILKSDVNGTLEAMKISLEKIAVEGTQIKILHSGVGAISESDVMLAQTYNGIIIGFNIRPDPKARRLINQHEVDVRTYRVIYQALEEIEAALKGMLGPTMQEQWKGQAEVRETFSVPRVGTVAGCFVLDGQLSRNHTVRLLRAGSELWEGRMASLRRFKDDVREVEKGYECGIKLDGFNDIKVGDVIESFVIAEEPES